MQRLDRNKNVTLALIAVGSNLPRSGKLSESIVLEAIEAVAFRGGSQTVNSRFYRTPAFPPGSGPDFVNAAFAMTWGGTPENLLLRLHEVEAAFGRERQTRWGARTLDLDLLALGDQVCPDRDGFLAWQGLSDEAAAARAPEELILPHPRLQTRAFVLVPLADIAPDWHHPVLGRSVAEMLQDLPQAARNDVVPLEGV